MSKVLSVGSSIGSSIAQIEAHTEEKKPDRTIADLPSYNGDLSKLPKIKEVKILTDKETWFLVFRHEHWSWSIDIGCTSQRKRENFAEMFETTPEETICKIKGKTYFAYTFRLYNTEGSVIMVCSDYTPYEKNLRGEIFMCEIPNPVALSQSSLNRGVFEIELDLSHN